jgi:hypothetical protein
MILNDWIAQYMIQLRVFGLHHKLLNMCGLANAWLLTNNVFEICVADDVGRSLGVFIGSIAQYTV